MNGYQFIGTAYAGEIHEKFTSVESELSTKFSDLEARISVLNSDFEAKLLLANEEILKRDVKIAELEAFKDKDRVRYLYINGTEDAPTTIQKNKKWVMASPFSGQKCTATPEMFWGGEWVENSESMYNASTGKGYGTTCSASETLVFFATGEYGLVSNWNDAGFAGGLKSDDVNALAWRIRCVLLD